MRVIWSPGRAYQAFAGPAENWFSLNGDRLSGKDDEFVGRRLGPGLMLVTNTSGEFSDIEGVMLAFTTDTLELPTAEPSGAEDVVIEAESRSAAVFLDAGARRVMIRLHEGEPVRWVRVGASGVMLGLRGDCLWMIFCEDVDLGGDEGAWLGAHGFEC